MNGSSTTPPGGHPAAMHVRISAGGNMAKCAPLKACVGYCPHVAPVASGSVGADITAVMLLRQPDTAVLRCIATYYVWTAAMLAPH
ncbi:MAG: hypothetical protein LBP85_04425 [Prevotellaceae bacterium]|nr:hypothetical protein [Prevotellaceae bacterium]